MPDGLRTWAEENLGIIGHHLRGLVSYVSNTHHRPRHFRHCFILFFIVFSALHGPALHFKFGIDGEAF